MYTNLKVCNINFMLFTDYQGLMDFDLLRKDLNCSAHMIITFWKGDINTLDTLN